MIDRRLHPKSGGGDTSDYISSQERREEEMKFRWQGEQRNHIKPTPTARGKKKKNRDAALSKSVS